MTTVRRHVARGAAALAAAAVLSVTAVPSAAPAVPASPASPADVSADEGTPAGPPAELPAGMYGTTDPTYDGVWRQSLAMLAQRAVNVMPADSAVAWLLGQQCDSGAFPAYRPDTTKPCDATTVVDTNSTAAAVQILAALTTYPDAMNNGMSWLASVQNKDGGWGYNAGAPSDANSTGLVIGALAAGGAPVGTRLSTEGRSPYQALNSFAIPCDAKEGGGAFAYQPDKSGKLLPNADATAAGLLGGIGKRMVTTGVEPGPGPVCQDLHPLTPERAARNGASYLVKALAKTGHLDQPPMPGADDSAPLPDHGNTADAVVALTTAGYGKQAVAPMKWLEKNSAAWAKENGPAAYAQLIFAAHTTSTDPRTFGGTDLVKALNATGPAPKWIGPKPLTTAEQQKVLADQKAEKHSMSGNIWTMAVGAFAALVICVLFVVRAKRRRS
ncbi:prenyltransferase/squalene oxidase repeat-containing protein [Streptomyces sp. NPDC059209]|uniref:prenyltransferase/squalene oxidase repeat-containing protein n=1 Tax=Streptomyces sp. NPDC059209 TaxID=3346769 RepID=UPI0036ACD9EA